MNTKNTLRFCRRWNSLAVALPLLMFVLSLVLAVPSRAQNGAAPKSIDFYGKKVSLLKMFGQPRWGEYSPGKVDATKIYHASGVLVDQWDHVYIADRGNSRILGFRSPDSPKAELIFGQPDEHSGAPNGDCNLGFFGPTGRDKLCLMGVPEGSNVAEQWARINFEVDKEGNLYFPDFPNNRVLMYRVPFSEDKSNGKGDTLPDRVYGQKDWVSNKINQGLGTGKCTATSLHLGGSTNGVSIDPAGNVWIPDTQNGRVLRFPPDSTTPNLVLGQPNFESSPGLWHKAGAPLDRLGRPTQACINPHTGELWVLDTFRARDATGDARFVVYSPPFFNGMKASRAFLPKQRLEGEFKNGWSFQWSTGFTFNRFLTDDWTDETHTHRYKEGLLWIHENSVGRSRTLLLNETGEILLAINAPDLITQGSPDRFYAGGESADKRLYKLGWGGGQIGFDSQNRMYIADEAWHRILRFTLPYRTFEKDGRRFVPFADFAMCVPRETDRVAPADLGQDRHGAFIVGNQLFVRDVHRYMVWNDYLNKPDGAPADLFVTQKDGRSDQHSPLGAVRTMHTVDNHNRLWARAEHRRLILFQLPFQANSQPLRAEIPLYWADDPDKLVDYSTHSMAFDAKNGHLWVSDAAHARILRVKNPDEWAGKLLVDAVIGQNNNTNGQVNRGQPRPDASSLGAINDLKFDRNGNLFVVNNTYEGHPNWRVIAFAAEDLAKIKTMFPKIEAKWVYPCQRFDQDLSNRILHPGLNPLSPVSVAFNSRNEMVIANDGYPVGTPYGTRHLNQLFLYRKPLESPSPDAVIELPMGTPAEMCFDEHDNFMVQDHTYNKVWIINFDKDPQWLRLLKPPAPPNAVWLDELDITKMTTGDKPPQQRFNNEGTPLSLSGGTQYVRGVGTHAPSDFALNLQGAATRFTATVGLDDIEPDGQPGLIQFQIWVNSKMVAQSPLLRKGQKHQFDVNLTGAQMLGLRVTDGGNGNAWDVADWCDALIFLQPGSKVRPMAIDLNRK